MPNMVNITKYTSHKSQKDPNKMIFVGRLVDRKGCSYLIRAFARLSSDNDKLHLDIIGRGEQADELQKLARQLGVAERVNFLGYISEEEKMRALNQATIACYPSLYGESFGIVLIEAMAAGALVVAGNNPGYSAVLEDNQNVLVNPKDVDLFYRKINNLMQDSQLHQETLSWQQSLVKKYDVETVGPQIEKWYLEAIAKNNEKSHN